MASTPFFRTLRREPGFVAAFIVTLGLGIGANSAIFSLVSGILLRPLPYPAADRLLAVKQPATLQGQDDIRFSFMEVEDYRQQSTTLEEVVEFGDWTFNVLDRGEPHRAVAGLVTSNFFEVLGMKPLLGRLILPEEESRSAAPVVVLTHEYWQRALAGNPEVIGQVLNLTSVQAEIVGVLEPGVHYASEGRHQDFYANYANSDHYVSATMQDDRDHRMTVVFARMKEGVTVEETAADLKRIASTLHAEHPEAYPEDLGLETVVLPWHEQLVSDARPVLYATLAGSLLVLLIACANVANLTLVRALRRSREVSVRAALGGSNRRIRAGFFLESLVLAVAGAILGVLIAYGLLDVLKAYASNLTTRSSEVAIDLRVLLATMVIAVACAAGLTLLPGIGPGRRLAESLSAGGARSVGSSGRSRSQRLLVVSQLAVSFLLLFGSIQLGRTLLNLYGVDPGFELEQVLTVDAPKFSRVPPEELKRFTDQAVLESEAIAGVESAAMTLAAPLRSTSPQPLILKVLGGDQGEEARAQPTVFDTVTAGYFSTLGIPMVRGREFSDVDREDSEKVVILNQSAARFHFGDEDPVGRQIAYDFGGFFAGQSDWLTVVGVAADTQAAGLSKQPAHALYLPDAQMHASGFFSPSTLLVRSQGDPHLVAGQVLENLRRIDPERPLEHVQTLAEARNESVAPQRLNALLFGSFAGLALLIATVGVGAMLMWSVSARRKELAVRSAMGAEPGKLLTQVLSEGALLLIAGLLVGGAAALVSGRFLSGMLFEVASTDTRTLLLAAGVLFAVGIVAALIPARRAMLSDPNELLRAD